MQKSLKSALVWFRRDLRAHDHAALHHALRAAEKVWCAFVFDTEILDPLPRADRRVEFIHDSVSELDGALRSLGGGHGRLLVRHGVARAEIVRLAKSLGVQAVYANRDDEPDAVSRDSAVQRTLGESGIAFHTSKDHVIFERSEVLTQSGTPYGVYTPYKNAWLKKIEPFFLKAYPIEKHAGALAPVPAGVAHGIPSLESLGFQRTNLHALALAGGSAAGDALLEDFLGRMDDYAVARDFPAQKGSSLLSVHLRFGTVSIRKLAALAYSRWQDQGSRGAEVWLSELIWRDFYHQLLHHHPHVVDGAYDRDFDRLRWDTGPEADERFKAWCEGRTGYPIIDAAMAQINQTGFMHNRLRMVTASFLAKDLGLDWRRGEAYFATHLNDFDLAANNGGWQWSASTGADSQPWFRIFNPLNQSRKFDPEGGFIRHYLPQLSGLPDKLIHAPWLAPALELEAAGVRLGKDYPNPVVDHDEARRLTMARYQAVKR